MKISQFHGEFPHIPYIPVVITLLPERACIDPTAQTAQPFGKRKLQIMDSVSECGRLRFAQQQMHVLGHDDVSVDEHVEAEAHVFQTDEEEIVTLHGTEVLFATITTEGHEVNLPGVVITMKVVGHVRTIQRAR